MRRRTYLAFGALALLVATAGCSTILGPGEPDPEQVNRNVSYDWDTDANASIDIDRSEYRAVWAVDNRTTMEFYRRDALGTEGHLETQGVKFRFTNGTVTNVSAANVTYERKQTVVDLPARNGRIAFAASRTGKQFTTPTFVTGTYEVTLPENARVGVPILAQVQPRGYEATRGPDGVTLRWDDVQSRSLSIRYYLARDLLIFGGMLGILVVAAAGGALYYLRQIRALERRREDVDIDVDAGDDEFDDGPPPGMR
jgi:hypothetical protein